jgi:hypothetical protein
VSVTDENGKTSFDSSTTVNPAPIPDPEPTPTPVPVPEPVPVEPTSMEVDLQAAIVKA